MADRDLHLGQPGVLPGEVPGTAVLLGTERFPADLTEGRNDIDELRSFGSQASFYYDGRSLTLLFCGADDDRAGSRLAEMKRTLEDRLGPTASWRNVP